MIVKYGILNHNVTRIDPMNNENVDITILNQIKFDVINDFITSD